MVRLSFVRAERVLFAVFVASSAWIAGSGCIYDWSRGASGTGGATGSTSQKGSTSSTQSPDVVSTSGSSTSDIMSSTTMTVTSSTGGMLCGGNVCSGSEYCSYPDHECGKKLPGTCTPIPAPCPDGDPPSLFCDCKGSMPAYECESEKDGTDIANASEFCQVKPGQRACGYRICEKMEYCQYTASEMNTPKEYMCLPYTGCGQCSCVPYPDASCFCDDSNGVFVKCN